MMKSTVHYILTVVCVYVYKLNGGQDELCCHLLTVNDHRGLFSHYQGFSEAEDWPCFV